MIVTLSAVALFGLLTFGLIRSRYVGPGAALAVFLFGFFTADTGASTAIRAAIQALINAASAIA
ncbi:hypothetical protein [Streptomyces sp. DH10]|uniref:hypothetical protein n=1 Tax=Streptomyces sp. DH10 TaxID=3040121 RepID=UPI002443398D|nr:hypothetical protein [Streptomyces sp. DH10]MDG9713424.1 hypothetical protein [Streptomyces sp. DH10]